jgi:hypothetical protein
MAQNVGQNPFSDLPLNYLFITPQGVKFCKKGYKMSRIRKLTQSQLDDLKEMGVEIPKKKLHSLSEGFYAHWNGKDHVATPNVYKTYEPTGHTRVTRANVPYEKIPKDFTCQLCRQHAAHYQLETTKEFHIQPLKRGQDLVTSIETNGFNFFCCFTCRRDGVLLHDPQAKTIRQIKTHQTMPKHETFG